MKGGIGWNLGILGGDQNPWEFYLMILFWKIDINFCQIYKKIYIHKILHKNCRFKQIIFSQYTTNPKTTIPHSSLRKLGLLLLAIEFSNFSLIKDKINNIIYTSVSRWSGLPPMAAQYTGHVLQTESRDNDTALSLVGVLVTWYRRIINYIYYKWKIIQFK